MTTLEDLALSVPNLNSQADLLNAIIQMRELSLKDFDPDSEQSENARKKIRNQIYGRSLDSDILRENADPENVDLAVLAWCNARNEHLQDFTAGCAQQNLVAYGDKHTMLEAADLAAQIAKKHGDRHLPPQFLMLLMHYQKPVLEHDFGDDAKGRAQAVTVIDRIYAGVINLRSPSSLVQSYRDELKAEFRTALSQRLESLPTEEHASFMEYFLSDKPAKYDAAMRVWLNVAPLAKIEDTALRCAFDHAGKHRIRLARIALRAREGSQMQRETAKFFP